MEQGNQECWVLMDLDGDEGGEPANLIKEKFKI